MTIRTGHEIAAAEALAEGGVLDLGGEQLDGFGQSLTQKALKRLRSDYLTLAALAVLAVLAGLSIAAPLFESALDVDYKDTNPPAKYLDLGAEGHVLGTDNLGRDHLARLLYGGRVSLGIGFAAAFLSLAIGIGLGVVAGFYQGGSLSFIDDFLMWFITTLNSIPQLFLLIIIASVLTRSVLSLIFILAVLGWTSTMRLVRGETLAQREREYILAARAIGSESPRIMFKHILPNIFSVLIVTLAIDIGSLILAEAALSFLSLGVQEPIPSWGNMLTKSDNFFRQAPHLSIIPGFLISITVLCLYLIGDGLRDAFDPQAAKK